MADEGRMPHANEYDAPPPRLSENKRKFEDAGPPDEQVQHQPSGRVTGFSDGPGIDHVSYNNVPPPKTEFELAKQKAEQIAARLVGKELMKRPRMEDVDHDDHGLGGHAGNGPDHDHHQGYSGMPASPFYPGYLGVQLANVTCWMHCTTGLSVSFSVGEIFSFPDVPRGLGLDSQGSCFFAIIKPAVWPRFCI